eukprot:TRINITY_DN13424_c0_g4_i2.p1 TRINITY_DN13424_c0_g4~~TRINITY_DN13424_c0_g4_i2.p1  ORF type:complete len:144 (+),score=9.97 TRINITY_DN13424_c0_g4_i2:240-671(+)
MASSRTSRTSLKTRAVCYDHGAKLQRYAHGTECPGCAEGTSGVEDISILREVAHASIELSQSTVASAPINDDHQSEYSVSSSWSVSESPEVCSLVVEAQTESSEVCSLVFKEELWDDPSSGSESDPDEFDKILSCWCECPSAK